MKPLYRLSPAKCPSTFTLFAANAALLLLFPLRLPGQTAQLSGAVKDPSGSVIVNATVTLSNQGTDVSRSAGTNADGVYVIPFLQPGLYRALIEATGFQAESRSDIRLEVGQFARWDVTLSLGKTEQTLTVTAGPTLLNTTDGSVSTVIDREFVENLPLNGRGFNALLELTPGVVTAKTSFNNQGQFSVNGQRTSSNYFTVDGVSANTGITASTGLNQTAAGTQPATSILGGMNALVSVDALQEFRVQTSSFAPEYGRTPGAQISIATRSGTNQFHGDVFDYFRNDKLDANNWFANQSRLAKPALRQNDFGGVVGGPVYRNRTFFFFSYEGLLLRQPQTLFGYNVPSMAARQAAPPVLQPFLNTFPLPNGPDLGNGFAQENATFSNPIAFDSTSVRIDHWMGHTAVFGRYARSSSSLAARAGSSVNPVNNVTTSQLGTWSVTGGATTTVSATIMNEARFNWTSTQGASRAVLDDFGGAQPIMANLLFPAYASPANSYASFLLGSTTNVSEGSLAGNSQKQVNVLDALSMAKGRHLIKIGLDLRILRPVAGAPAYTTSAVFTTVGDPTKSTGQQTPGSLLSGVISSGSVTSRDAEFGSQYLNASTFAQDTWRMTSRVTMTYGVRWDIAPPPSGTDGHRLLALTNLQSLSSVAYAPAGTPLWNTDYRDFAPRVGITYRIRNVPDSGLVLRAGTGIFYDLTGGYIGSQTTSPPNAASRTIPGGSTFPYSVSAIAPPPLPASPPYTAAIGIDPDLKTARVYQWNLALEQQTGSYGIVSATYLGSVGRDLARATQYFNPNPSFNSLIVDQSNAISNYQSLQLQFRGRFGARAQVLSSYSLAHSIDTASADVSGTGVPLTRVDPHTERGPSDFDVRQSFSTALTINSPRANGAWWSALVRDWSIDAILQARSAFPVDIWVQRNLGFGTYLFRPDLLLGEPEYVEDPNVGGGRRVNNTRPIGVPYQVGVFVIPSELRQGNLGRNATRGFGMYQADFALRREFSINEHFRLQVKAEVFNVLNHPNFADPVQLIGTVSPTGTLTVLPTFGQSTNMLGTILGSGGVNGGLSPLYQVGGPRSMQLSLKLVF